MNTQATWTKWDETWAVRITGEQPTRDTLTTTVVITKKNGETSEASIWTTPEWTKGGVAIYHLSQHIDAKGARPWLKAEGYTLRNGSVYAL